jgi:hypothetical protein
LVRSRRRSTTSSASTASSSPREYARLFFQPEKSIEVDLTVADVGAGYPHLLVTTVDTSLGPRTHVGVVSAYHELVTTNFERLTDEKWASRFAPYPFAPRAAEVAGLADTLAH